RHDTTAADRGGHGEQRHRQLHHRLKHRGAGREADRAAATRHGRAEPGRAAQPGVGDRAGGDGDLGVADDPQVADHRRAGVDSAIAAPQKVAAMKSSVASFGGRGSGSRLAGSMPPRTPAASPKPTDSPTASGADKSRDPGPPSAPTSARTAPTPNTPPSL